MIKSLGNSTFMVYSYAMERWGDKQSKITWTVPLPSLLGLDKKK